MILKNKLGKIILFTTILGVGSYFVPLPNNGIIKSEIVAEAAQSKQIKGISNLLAIAGGTYKSWAGGLIKLFAYDVDNQMAPFRAAVSKKKGVEYSYIAHFSNTTTDTYSTNFKYVTK